MANFKGYNYAQTMTVPVTLTDQLIPGTLEYAIHHLTENCIDMSIFDSKYKNDSTGAPAYDPKILLKVILFGYSRGLIHSRKIEKACRENIIFMALCCGKAPDYSTICNFVKTMESELIQIFRNILLVCEKEDLLGGSCFALDGCKLPSNASQNWSGTHSQLQKKMQRMENKVKKIMQKHISQDALDIATLPESAYKQIQKLERNMKKIQTFLDSNEPKVGARGEEVKSNITDNDSAQMKTSHGSIQGYNAQAFVDSKTQVIISSAAFGDGQDYNHVSPLLDQAKENMQAIGKSEDYFQGKELLCDTSYHSQENLSKSAHEYMDAYIPDKNYRKRDPRLNEKSRVLFSAASFSYDPENDQYLCPNGSPLKIRDRNRKKHGRLYRMYVSKESDCSSCSLRKQCLASDKAKQRYLYVLHDKKAALLTHEMHHKFDTVFGREIYDKRARIVEPVFGNIRSQKRLDRFTLRGKKKVNIQWRLFTIIHNIEKIVNYGSDNAYDPVLT